jgi:glutathione S-transferase
MRSSLSLAAAALPALKRVYAGPGPNPEVLLCALAHHGHDVRALTRKLRLAPDGKTPENRSESMIKLNPAATSPFVELEDGTVLAESVAIVRYLDALALADGTDGAPPQPLLTGGPDAVGAAVADMWQKRIEHQVVTPWQRQFQNGEGAHYFARYVPWIDASRPSVPGLRKQVVENLAWLEGQLEERAAATGGGDAGFLAGGPSYTVADLQLALTADFMGDKCNTARATESFDAREGFGPRLSAWHATMQRVVGELKGRMR